MREGEREREKRKEGEKERGGEEERNGNIKLIVQNFAQIHLGKFKQCI